MLKQAEEAHAQQVKQATTMRKNMQKKQDECISKVCPRDPPENRSEDELQKETEQVQACMSETAATELGKIIKDAMGDAMEQIGKAMKEAKKAQNQQEAKANTSPEEEEETQKS